MSPRCPPASGPAPAVAPSRVPPHSCSGAPAGEPAQARAQAPRHPRRARHRRPWGAVVLAGALAGCGGGVSLGIGIGWGDDDDPPRVALSASAATVPPGGGFTLWVDARDDGVVEQVDFFEVLPDGSRRWLRDDGVAPYELVLQAPVSPGVWRYQAVAYDNWGQRGYSEVLTITVQP